jgi:hypothetical protein
VETLLLLVAIFAGSVLQRVTGMGFALVAAPFIVLIAGPVTGVILVNVCGALTSATVLLRVFRHVEWKKYFLLVPAAFLGIVPGALVVQNVPAPWLEVFVGGTVVAGLATASALGSSAWRPGGKALLAAGSVSGFMNATAGVGGPALSVYALTTRWRQTEFAATMQPYFLTIGIASIAAKLIAKPSSTPDIPIGVWALICGAILAGLFAGDFFARRTGVQTARRLMLILAYIGSIATIVRGVWSLIQ